jgi:hypothetical protein
MLVGWSREEQKSSQAQTGDLQWQLTSLHTQKDKLLNLNLRGMISDEEYSGKKSPSTCRPEGFLSHSVGVTGDGHFLTKSYGRRFFSRQFHNVRIGRQMCSRRRVADPAVIGLA